MELNSKYSIEADNLNVILTEKVKSKDGVDRLETLGYFFNCGEALKFLIDHEVKGTGIKDLAAVAKKIAELRELIDRLALSRLSVRDFSPEGQKNRDSELLYAVIDPNPIKDIPQEDVTANSLSVTDNTDARKCVVCDGPMPDGSRSDAKFCSDKCRVAHHRQQPAML